MNLTQQLYPDRTAPGVRSSHPTIGRWQLVRRIREGPLSCVWQARPDHCPPHWPADYAVKMPRAIDEDGFVAVDLLRREALVATRVSHPNLLCVLAARLNRPPFYVVTPYLEGMSLQDWLANVSRVRVTFALWITRQVAQALAALHSAGWLHGDVKPQNILLSAKGHATLIDLGFARQIKEPCSSAEGSLMGTMHYVAPERICSKLIADHRSDIYSLGVTLYEMVTGRLPFEGDDAAAVVEAHLRSVPTNPRKLVPQLPSRVSDLLKTMLAKDPLRRPCSAIELVHILTALEIETFEDWDWTASGK